MVGKKKGVVKYNSNQRRELRKTLMTEHVTQLPEIGRRGKANPAGFYMKIVNSLSKKTISEFESDVSKAGIAQHMQTKRWKLLFKRLTSNEVNKLWNLIQIDKETEPIAPGLNEQYEEVAFKGGRRRKSEAVKPVELPLQQPNPPPSDDRPKFHDHVLTIVSNINTVIKLLGLQKSEISHGNSEAIKEASLEETDVENSAVTSQDTKETAYINDNCENSDNCSLSAATPDIAKIDEETSSDVTTSSQVVDCNKTAAKMDNETLANKLSDTLCETGNSCLDGEKESKDGEIVGSLCTALSSDIRQQVSDLLHVCLAILNEHFMDIDPKGENIFQLKLSVDDLTSEMRGAVDRIIQEMLVSSDRLNALQATCDRQASHLTEVDSTVSQVLQHCKELQNNGTAARKPSLQRAPSLSNDESGLRLTRAQQLQRQKLQQDEEKRRKAWRPKLKRTTKSKMVKDEHVSPEDGPCKTLKKNLFRKSASDMTKSTDTISKSNSIEAIKTHAHADIIETIKKCNKTSSVTLKKMTNSEEGDQDVVRDEQSQSHEVLNKESVEKEDSDDERCRNMSGGSSTSQQVSHLEEDIDYQHDVLADEDSSVVNNTVNMDPALNTINNVTASTCNEFNEDSVANKASALEDESVVSDSLT